MVPKTPPKRKAPPPSLGEEQPKAKAAAAYYDKIDAHAKPEPKPVPYTLAVPQQAKATPPMITVGSTQEIVRFDVPSAELQQMGSRSKTPPPCKAEPSVASSSIERPGTQRGEVLGLGDTRHPKGPLDAQTHAQVIKDVRKKYEMHLDKKDEDIQEYLKEKADLEEKLHVLEGRFSMDVEHDPMDVEVSNRDDHEL